MAGERVIPSWLKNRLSIKDVDRIESSVREAEFRTSLEVLPIIVRRSSVIGQVPIVLMLILMVAGLLGMVAGREFLDDRMVAIVLAAILPVAAILGWLLAKCDPLQRLLIPDADEEAQVRRRASAEFMLNRVSSTRGRTGVLFFVSVMERRAVVLPDVGLAKILTPEVCGQLVTEMALHLHDGNWAMAFEAAIRDAGNLAAETLPKPSENPNELGNTLQIKD